MNVPQLDSDGVNDAITWDSSDADVRGRDVDDDAVDVA